ncbi:MAG TPA: flavin prenyltransferase UbiX [Dissulfurispiraceae bacterium]
MKKHILAITGASGAVFGVRVLEELLKSSEVHLVISSNTFSIIRDETGNDWAINTEKTVRKQFGTDRLFFYEDKYMEAPVASGSFRTDGMLVVPCSMKTLSGIANGYANNLIERAADVVIKEGRPLLLSPREMPFSALHLENMLKLARLGVRIAPPVPAFYHKPHELNDVVDFIVGKILDNFGVEHSLFKRWGE